MPINETYAGGAYFSNIFAPTVAERIKEILFAPINHPEMVWIAIPLLITLLFLEFYFGRYRDEELGWNTALGNSLLLVFVGLDLLRRIYGERFFSTITLKALPPISAYAIIAIAILAIGLIMILINFFHLLPKSFAFIMSSPLAVNLSSYLAIAFIYSSITIGIASLTAAFIIFISAILLIDIIHLFEPKYKAPKKTNVETFLNSIMKRKKDEKSD
ncbi:hypothetical protein HYY72_03175 [Candidatus Woesearchaeota archaeon]|nr:hypothetical protein [Candidatus Woesearchaeota archaeon]